MICSDRTKLRSILHKLDLIHHARESSPRIPLGQAGGLCANGVPVDTLGMQWIGASRIEETKRQRQRNERRRRRRRRSSPGLAGPSIFVSGVVAPHRRRGIVRFRQDRLNRGRHRDGGRLLRRPQLRDRHGPRREGNSPRHRRRAGASKCVFGNGFGEGVNGSSSQHDCNKQE